jgi:hypothetical protein
LLLLQNLLNRLLTVDLPGLMVLPQRLEISIPPSVTSIAEAAVGRDTIMRAVASAVLQVGVTYVAYLHSSIIIGCGWGVGARAEGMMDVAPTIKVCRVVVVNSSREQTSAPQRRVLLLFAPFSCYFPLLWLLLLLLLLPIRLTLWSRRCWLPCPWVHRQQQEVSAYLNCSG